MADDIIVNITDGVANIAQEGFGVPKIFGETQQYKVLKTGTGKSELVWRSVARGGDAGIEIETSGSTILFTLNGTDLTVTIPTAGATAKEVYDEWVASADTAMNNLLELTLSSSGTGAVADAVIADLDDVDEFDLRSLPQVATLLPYYDDTDPEYIMAAALFGQELTPEKVYVLNGYAASPPAISTRMAASDFSDYYFTLLTSTTKARIIEANTYAETNEKLLVALCTDATILDDLSVATATAVVLCTSANLATRPDAIIVGRQAPKTPGSTTWMWQPGAGAVAETNTALINSAYDGNGNLFKSSSSTTYFVKGVMANGLFIDQKHSRDYMKARIAEAFTALFVAEEKIPFDDTGFAQLAGTLNDKLNSFGDNGIIARAVSSAEVSASYNKKYQFSITAPSRAQVLANSELGNPTTREYVISFSYVEAGAVHELTVNGKVVLTLP